MFEQFSFFFFQRLKMSNSYELTEDNVSQNTAEIMYKILSTESV